MLVCPVRAHCLDFEKELLSSGLFMKGLHFKKPSYTFSNQMLKIAYDAYDHALKLA